MKKLLIIILLCSFINSCGTIMNNKKPDLRDKQAIEDAYKHRVIQENGYYFLGNMGLLLLFPIGTILGTVGAVIDAGYHNYWQVTDQQAYVKWQEKYLEKVKQEREELLK